MFENSSDSLRWEEGSVIDATEAIDVLTAALQSRDDEVMKSALGSISDDLDWCDCDRLTALFQEVQLRVNGVIRKPR